MYLWVCKMYEIYDKILEVKLGIWVLQWGEDLGEGF